MPGGEKPEGGDRGEDHLPLLAVGGAEVEAGGAVGDHPGLHLPVGVGRAHVGERVRAVRFQSMRRASSPGS